MTQLLAIVAVTLMGATLAFSSMRTASVERSTTIHAAPERIVRLIENFYIWRAWSPYERQEPMRKRSYSGPSRGRGAVYAWEGGRMEILDSSRSQVMIKLDFTKPFKRQTVAQFKLEPHGDTTRLTWAMPGRDPWPDFQVGLQNLKAIAEK